MKKYGMFGVAVGILSVSAVCLATTALSSNPAFITAVEVDHIGSAGDGDVAALTSTFVSFSEQPNTRPASCTGVESVIAGSADNVRNTTALATSAMLAGKKVKVIYSTVTPVCAAYGGLTYAKVAGFRVEQ